MSSRVFKANTGHSKANPQLCGLTQLPINEGDLCFYLVCKGTNARPEYQISVVAEKAQKGRKYKKKIRETPDGQSFFSVFTGEWETFKKPDGTTGRRRVYEWQTEDPVSGVRIPVKVWSHMVLADSAESLGYNVPRKKNGKYVTTKAHVGDRTKGFEHRSAESEPAMLTVAKAALGDEDAGLVPPNSEIGEEPAALAVEEPEEDEASLAEALGITVERFRELNAVN